MTVHQQLQTPKEGHKTFPYEVGDQVFAGFNFDSQMNADWFIADHLREMPMLFLVLAFFALLIGFGRFKGFNTVVSLVLTCAAVFFVMIPAIIKGYNIYLVTFITAVFTIVMTLCIVIGVHPKSIAAAVAVPAVWALPACSPSPCRTPCSSPASSMRIPALSCTSTPIRSSTYQGRDLCRHCHRRAGRRRGL